jgi:acetyltransferase
MSAARHFAKNKPIIVVKSGRFARSAKAAASHTGALAGDDNFYDAAFKRAGAIRVLEIEDLFGCSAALAVQTRPRGPRLAIITNAGGPGVLAADRLIDKGGVIAELSDETVEALDKVLPPFWSRENPVDILGDATPERYRDAVTYLLQDKNVDGIIVLLTPQAMTDPDGAAKLVSEVASGNMSHYKPLLASWMGADAVESGRDILELNSIPNFETPEQAVDVYLQMYQYTKNIASLYEAPGDIVRTFTPRRDEAKNLFRAVAGEKRTILTEIEAKAVLDAYQIPVARMLIAKSREECASLASEIGFPVAVKILSPDVTHKTDVGGVILDVTTPEDAKSAFEHVVANTKASQPDAIVTGATVQKMIDRDQGYEIIIGSKFDSLFGPAILFGAGGTAVELFRDLTLGFPPLNQVLARRMIEDTKIYNLLKGFRDKPPANILFIEEILVKISYMLKYRTCS